MCAACPAPPEGLPCDIAPLVSQKCLNCHSTPLKHDAPMTLLGPSDFAARSMLDDQATNAQRSLLRVKQGAAPMPPANAPPLTAAELATFEEWVNAGAPAGTCATDPDAGLPIAAGPPPLTCQSGLVFPAPTTTAPGGGPQMAPGQACRACHLGENFEGQNPGGALGMTPAYDVMGTVYRAPNEKDLCASSAADAGIVVEIRDARGVRVISTEVGPSGNFYADVPGDAGFLVPYTAKVVDGTRERRMMTAQVNGDCNQCHTQYGREAAPGRILAP